MPTLAEMHGERDLTDTDSSRATVSPTVTTLGRCQPVWMSQVSSRLLGLGSPVSGQQARVALNGDDREVPQVKRRYGIGFEPFSDSDHYPVHKPNVE